MIASRTASAPAPVTAGPFLTLGPRSGSGGRCSSIVKRLERSTSVPMAERSVPMIRSPSQCPGTARSAASGGGALIIPLGGALADHHLVGDKALPARADSGPRDAQRPAGAQARGQLAGQRAATLHEQRLVDRLVGDPHRRIIGEVDPQPGGDLLRAPCARPPAVLATRLVAALPWLDRRTSHRRPVE